MDDLPSTATVKDGDLQEKGDDKTSLGVSRQVSFGGSLLAAEIDPIAVRNARGETLVQYRSQRINQNPATCPWAHELRKCSPQSRKPSGIVPVR